MTDPIELSITLDIDKVIAPTYSGYDEDGEPVGAEPRTLEDVVLDLATQQVVAGLDKEIRRDLGQRVRAIRDEMIREALDPLITEALTGPIQQTNSYGETVGKETTLREIITTHAQKALTLTTANNRRGYEQTPATKVLIDEVEKSVKKHVKDIVDQVKAETSGAIRDAAADAIAKAVA